MLGAQNRENRRRSENTRSSHQGSHDATHSRGLGSIGSSISVSADHLERNVAANFLHESKLFDGFVYMLRHTDHPVAKTLRSKLFPAVAVALEATLRKAVEHQMAIERAQDVPRQSTASAKGKLLRNTAYFPENDIDDKGIDIIRILAEELRKAASH